MAKTREQNSSGASELQQELAAPPIPASETSSDGMDLASAIGEIERLRRENSILRKGAANPTGLSAQRGKPHLYRVKLPGCRPLRSQRVIEPKLSAKPEMLTMTPVSYDDLGLFLNEAELDTNKLDQAAWMRYVAEGHQMNQTDASGKALARPLDPIRDRSSFNVHAMPGTPGDYLDIPAASPADAFALFCKFNGILSTAQKPSVDDLGEIEEAAVPMSVAPVAPI